MDPWRLHADGLDPAVLPRWAALLTLSNGYLGARGDLDEGDPGAPEALMSGTLLRPVYEERPLSYAERGYSYPAYEQRIVPVATGAPVRLRVQGEPMSLRDGTFSEHRRVLDLREGVLDRQLVWTSPLGHRVAVSSQRLVPLTRRAVLAVAYEVTALDRPLRVSLRSELVGGGTAQPSGPDRLPLALLRTWSTGALLVQRTATSGITVVSAAEHLVEAGEATVSSGAGDDGGTVSVDAVLPAGEGLRLVKFVSYAALAAGVHEAGPVDGSILDSEVETRAREQLADAVRAGWPGLQREQRAYLDQFWERADVEVDGDEELQLGVRLALFHLVQAAAQVDGHGIPAKGLTGPGYDGHTFWEQESFLLPVLTRVLPESAAALLRWRHATLPRALERAANLRLGGAAFPWRTITGRESSGYWPAGTAAFHVNADIADAVVRYVDATGDEEIAGTVGVDLLVQTARLWASLCHLDADGSCHIDGVTGPDEYSAVADDNAYTNLMAQRNLRAAVAAALRHAERAQALGVTDAERRGWEKAAAGMAVPRNDVLGVTEQSAGFTRHALWNFPGTPEEDYPLADHHPYFQLYRKQVVKQADLVFALWRCGRAFSPEQARRDFDYYEALTVRDSSLSAPIQAVVAAQVGHLGLAHEYARETALLDLQDLRASTGDGLHLASLAGTWLALVAGFGGARDDDGLLCFAPRLPPALPRLRFRLQHADALLQVEVTERAATYELLTGSGLVLRHQDCEVRLSPAAPVATLPLAPHEDAPRPPHPPFRAPGHCDLSRGSAARGQG